MKAGRIGLIMKIMAGPQLSRILDDQITHYRLTQAAQRARAESLPYIGVNHVAVYVHDQDRSLKFYCEQLGFHLVVDTGADFGDRWVAVAPSDGSALLALIKVTKESPEGNRVGWQTGVALVTEDIAAKVREWSERGVRFLQPPTPVSWGIHSSFEDIDGNQFDLIQSPWLIETLNAERRTTEERREAERRASYEVEIAKQVQAQLFPQKRPPLATLEYLGCCMQARDVGGDYYDFLHLAPGRVGLVLADVSGKGISAALLMANLQANLRSQYALALKDVPELLKNVNRLFCGSTPAGMYATMFFGDYEDSTRLMRYVNCGHNPPLLLHNDGRLDRLDATATVLGLFARWECAVEETKLRTGDTLVIYSDGVTDAESDDGEQFGDARLIDTLVAHHHQPVAELLDIVVTTMEEFSGREREDDVTLVIARAQ